MTGPQHLAEGANQKVDGSATDNAGNSASTTVTGINVDKTAPNLSAAPTTSPNENGWYNTDVTQTWSADDALSGLAGDKPSDSILSTEGEGQTASASVSDLAGNTHQRHQRAGQDRQDRAQHRRLRPSGWVNSSVDVTLTPHDALSGVDATHYSVDGGAEQTGTTVTLTSEGTHTISYGSTDKAGNAEASSTVTVQHRHEPPRPSPTRSTPEAERQRLEQHRRDRHLHLRGPGRPVRHRELHGTADRSPPRATGQPVTGTATDKAGNTADGPGHGEPGQDQADDQRQPHPGRQRVRLEQHRRHRPLRRQGRACPASTSVTADHTFGEGTDQSLEGTAVDAAGNSASTTVGGINVDETAPDPVAASPPSPPNGNGWYTGDVTIDWTADDDRSGVVVGPGRQHHHR